MLSACALVQHDSMEHQPNLPVYCLTKMKLGGKSMSDFSSKDLSESVQRSSLSGKGSGKLGSSSLGSLGGSGNFAALETSGWWLFLQTLLHVPSTPQEMHELILEKMSIAFMSLNLGYVVILKYCLQAFSCFDFEGTKYMYFNADELCYTPEHFQTMLAAAAGLIVYIAGTWFMFITVLRVLKQTNSFCECQIAAHGLRISNVTHAVCVSISAAKLSSLPRSCRQETTTSAVWVDV
eukprot:1137394-Pelagomonas_calceolata.AAC.3